MGRRQSPKPFWAGRSPEKQTRVPRPLLAAAPSLVTTGESFFPGRLLACRALNKDLGWPEQNLISAIIALICIETL